jgi:formylglycine-generating enzyme required for sulfatase activity
MVGDVLTDTERQSDVWKLNASLLETDMPGTDDSGTTIWWRAWLAAQVAIEQELHQQQTLNRLVELPVKKALIEWLVHLIETPQALPPIDRAACGRALSLLGDPRPGVGCIEVPLPSGEGFRVRAEGSGVRAAGVAIPDIVWCDVPMPPGGKVWLGADDQSNNPRREVAIPYSYQIAKYPVTYRQFQAFIDDPEGFYDPRWWDGLADDKYRRHNQSAPDDQYFKYWNHPRENVSWYQAMAFCRWFSWRLGGGYDLDKIETWAVRLPTEWEWEYAARGTDERPYPYLGAFDATKSNTNETGIGQTSAVGLFPDGAAPAPCGALDMSGNVREWCLSAYNESKDNPAEEDISTNVLRVVRSGSWVVNGTDYFRADFRYWYYSFIGNNNWGFRFARSYK